MSLGHVNEDGGSRSGRNEALSVIKAAESRQKAVGSALTRAKLVRAARKAIFVGALARPASNV